MPNTVRFLQLSDLHLDSSLTGGKLRLPRDRAEQRRREMRQLLTDAMGLARDRSVDVVLLVGDLFDDEAVANDTVNFVIDILGSEPRLPVVLLPGNHDPYSLASPYCDELRDARGQPPWPSNVHRVRESRFAAFRHPDLPGVSITAMGHDRNRPVEERLLATLLPRLEEPLQLLLLHGSRDHYAPPGKRITLPFSDAELLAQGFHYAALGHYHTYAAIEGAGRILGCYAGCPAGRNLQETGPRFVLLGEVSRDGDRVHVEVEPVRLDRRQVGQVRIPVQGITHREALLRRLREAVEASGYGREDILLVEASGRVPRGIDARVPPEFLADRYFHIAFDTTRLVPDYDLEVYLRRAADSIEGRFVREMQSRIAAAAGEERRLLENALFYGLDALIQKEVEPRYED